MTALKAQWQQQRQQRQQELIERQRQINTMLASFHTERQINGSQLRDDLSLLQLKLQQNTQELLNHFTGQRHISAQQMFQELQSFTQTLQLETAQILKNLSVDRSQKAEQLMQELDQFHHQLHASVAILQEQFKADLRDIADETIAIRADAQAFLLVQHQKRLQCKEQLMHNLQSYVDNLQTQVEDYLTNLELLRHERSRQLQQSFCQQRNRRIAEMDELFQVLSEFRTELRAHRANLHQSVWGDETASVLEVQPRTELAATQVSSAVLASEPIVPHQVHEVTTPVISIQQRAELAADVEPESVQLEEEIYTLIYESEGSRLTEIESKLGSTRFHVVEALRSLIKKGLITQRDRIYYVQEDINL